MGLSNKHGTASLSKSQRKQFQAFKKKNIKRLQGVTVMQMVQIWRDGYIIGCIHGWDNALEYANQKYGIYKTKRMVRK